MNIFQGWSDTEVLLHNQKVAQGRKTLPSEAPEAPEVGIQPQVGDTGPLPVSAPAPKREVANLTFTVPGPPVPAPRMSQRDQWLKPPRPCVDRYFKYRDRLRRVVGHVPVPLAITLRFFVPMPESWSQKKRDAMTGQPCRTKPDLDNYIKAVCDGLWENDSAVAAIKAYKTWTWESGWTCIDLTP